VKTVHVPGVTTFNLQDGRHLAVGRAANVTVRVRQQVAGARVSIFDQAQPSIIERLRGDIGEIMTFRENLAPAREGRTWVITHVAMWSQNDKPVSLELSHRKVRHSFCSPWLTAGEQCVMPLDVTALDQLGVWSGQTAEAMIVLRGLMIWSPEAVEEEKKR
jgi:hypothetical protein